MESRFIALYQGATVSNARLLALSADERIVARFYELLLPETEQKPDVNPGGAPLAVVHGDEA